MNTWLHSFLLVLVFGPVLLAARTGADALFAGVERDRVLYEVAAPPLGALALLLPALVLGWHTRRHPLLVGAAAAIVAQVLGLAIAATPGGAFRAIGELLYVGLVVAVAALAGRALRYRFAPAPAAAPA